VAIRGDNVPEATSFVKRELRSLNDVEVADNDPHYTVGLILLNVKSNTGIEVGVDYSWITLYNPYSLVKLLDTTDKLLPMVAIGGFMKQLGSLEDHQL
jgi:hypothetical protein